MVDSSQEESTSSNYNLTGHFLIAMPSLTDDFFNHAVTYICEHDDTGSFGIIINQKTDITLKQVAKEMNISGKNDYDENQSVFLAARLIRGAALSCTVHPVTGSPVSKSTTALL